MIRHMIIWTLKDEYSDAEKAEIKKGVKSGLEGLQGRIPGMLNIRVVTEGLPSANADLMLDSLFENVEALKGYSVNPLHQAVANEKVRPFVKIRSCFDFEER